ncbi:MAG: alpha-L-fucosidase [Kiritimatiellae bacterium]|nr:alpha-L-fucosidase [Kiritimatiellia bacterium]
MKQDRKTKASIIAAFVMLSVATNAAEYKPEKWNLEAREKFAEQRYGVFIVWGIYANYAQGEWYLHSGKLDRDAYERMVYGFYPSKYDACEWARIVRRSGAKYITITARHHDGFALWPSKMDDYNIGSTPFKRDIIGELSEACKAEGIQLSLYYSLLDWHRSDYTPGGAWLKVPIKGQHPDYASYKRYMMGQITELLDNYHPINIWFDGEWDHLDKDRGGTFDWGFDDIFDLIHSRKVLVANNNHRAPRPKEDIQLFERDLPGEGTMFSKHQPLLDDRPVEQCDVIQAGVWGYKIGEKRFLTAEESVALIVRAAAKGSNLLLNIGPDGSGQIPAKAVEVFEGIGKWFDKNGDSIYGTKAGGVSMGQKVVSTRKGDTLYIHFLDPAVKKFSFLLDGKKITLGMGERPDGDVSDIVVPFPLDGKEPEQYVEPGSRPMWKIVGETCKNPGNASSAIDGNLNSLWHSHPEPMKDHDPLPPPQSFTVDCGAVREMRGFSYTPRPASCSVGVVDKCEFWVSLDGANWTKAGEGNFHDVMESRATRKILFAKPVRARYFRFVATHALPVNDRLAVAEVDVF